MKRLFLILVIIMSLSGCATRTVDYSFFENNGALEYRMEKNEKSEAEFLEENKRLIMDKTEEEKQDLYNMLSPHLCLYTDDSTAVFEYGCLYDRENERYEILEGTNQIIIRVTLNNNEEKFVFNVINQETLQYVQKESSKMEFVEDGRISVPESAIFKLILKE